MEVEWETHLVGIDFATRQTIVGLVLTARASIVRRVWV